VNPIGFLTNIYSWNGVSELDRIVDAAVRMGFDSLELGPAIEASEANVRRIRDAGLEVSDLIYCRNLLSPDAADAAHHRGEVERRIAAAADLGIPVVVLCAGYADPCADLTAKDSYATIRRPPLDNLEPFLATYGPLIENAAKRGVRIAFEHCPIMGNWLISPHLWRIAFDRLDNENAGLCFDPSHLVWQFIDSYAAVTDFADRIFHVHAKDTEIFRDRLARRGVLSDFAWWENRLPGFGELNWSRLFALLRSGGYEGPVSIEHEDPTWNGSVELVDAGLAAARDHLMRAARAADANAAIYAAGDEATERMTRRE
jgi:sugar phosphate isomerase/epimerase